MAANSTMQPVSLTAKGHLPYLDGWRGLAICCVLVGHFFPLPWINLGTLGVELFFVLSGRLMAKILFVDMHPLVPFYKRRFSRIYPALFVFVMVSWVVLSNSEMAFGVKSVITSLTFIFNYNLWIPGVYVTGALNHIWSLCIEEHAYVILGFIAYGCRKWRWNAVAITAVASLLAIANGMLLTWVFHEDYFRTYWRTDVHVSSIFMSVAVFLFLSRRPGLRLPALMPVLFLALGVAINFHEVPNPIKFSLGTWMLALSVNSLEYAPQWFRDALSWRVLTFAGVTSYSLYLWQQPFFIALPEQASAVTACMYLVPAVLVSLLSFYCVETPLRKKLNRYWAKA